ncbi:hypothetical protein [uncultured Kordia sp.]|uniref:hypothetical protein n=1 Tax=uncultured Kordia sp. TaxID=507699 RepID=UPI00261CC99E|nr:hypothetical protein [uncultured Kordia sp.]
MKEKNYFKHLLVIIGVSIISIACQQDDFQNFQDYEKETTAVVLPELRASVLKGDSIFKTNMSLKNAVKKFTTTSNFLQRTVLSHTYNFSIDTTYVQKLVTDTYQSYTFKVKRTEVTVGVLENYVYTIFNDGTFKQYLIAYPLQSPDERTMYDFRNASIQEIHDATLIQRESGCASIVAYEEPICINYDCSIGGGDGSHSPGEACDNGEFSAVTICTGGGWIDQGCGDNTNGGTNYNPIDYDPNNTTTGGNTNTSGNTNTNNDSTNNNNNSQTNDTQTEETGIITPEDAVSIIPFNFEAQNEDPCGKINELLNDPDIKAKIQNLKLPATLNLNYEKGFDLKDDGSGLQLTPNNGTPGNTHIRVRIDPENGSTTGFIHSHFNGVDMTPLFTIEDIKTFNGIYQWRTYRGKPVKDLTAVVVSQGGVYAVVIKDYTKFAIEGRKLHTEEFIAKSEKYYEDYPEDTNLMQHTVTIENLVIKKLDTYGVALYKANADLSGWNELTVNAQTNETVSTPCN